MQAKDAANVALITKAYAFAQKAHADQKRFSGASYFIHPAEVAYSLARIGMDPATIAAGLLHDVVEDAHVSEEVISTEFSPEVLSLVQGVTKLCDQH
jgi:GTP pyrophosphokinase